MVETVQKKMKDNLGSFKRSLKENYQLLILLSIPFTWLVIFRYGPMYGLMLAFKDYNVKLGMMASEWIGFQNFEKFFNSYMFSKVLINTLFINLYYLLASFPMPIILALAINSTRRKKYGKVVQSMTYMPYFISTVVLVGIVLQLLNPRVGMINQMITFFGGTPKDFMADPSYFAHIYVWSGVWQNCGYAAIVYLAALSSVDRSLHESAMIDGATRFQRLRHIDLQCILPTAGIMLILSAGRVMNLGFEKIFLMQNNLNSDASEVIQTYIYKIGLSSAVPDLPLATAVGMFNSVTSLILVLIVSKISKKFSNTGLV